MTLDRLRLLGLLRVARARAGLLILVCCALALAPSAGAVLTGLLADRLAEVVRGAPSGLLTLPLAGLVLLLIGEQLGQVVQSSTATGVAQRIDASVRSRVRRCFLGAPLALAEDAGFADDAARAGELASVNGFVRSPGRAAGAQIGLVLRFVAAILSAAVVARYSWWLAGTLLVVAAGTREIARRRWQLMMDVRDRREDARRRAGYWTELALDAGAGKEIRLFGLAGLVTGRRREEMWAWLGDVSAARMSVLRLEWWLMIPRGLVAGVALYLPGAAVIHEGLPLGELVQTSVAAFGVLALSNIGGETFMVAFGLQSLQALRRLEGRVEPLAAAVSGDANTASEPALIEIEDLSFGDPKSPQAVLDGLSLTIRPHEVLALVGRNGIGKTTLIKLLCGLYPPDSGTIRVDGAELLPQHAARWQRQVAVVFQNFIRYPLTAAENIALGAPEHRADADGIRRAAERAGLGELIDGLPAGLETVLSRERRGGTDLSGGQWQKLAIARALFAVGHGRTLLILDEPTAHLDVRAEAEFYRQVVAEVAVLISHRLSTVRSADRIVLLDGTGPAEEGNHRSLMAAGGAYARMFALQAARFAEESEVAEEDGEAEKIGERR
jgi:ATP-binding cassette subfamily B protein